MEGHAIHIEIARAFHVGRLNFKHVVATVAVVINPFADGITREGRLDLLRPGSPVSINATRHDVLRQYVCGFVFNDTAATEIYAPTPLAAGGSTSVHIVSNATSGWCGPYD